MTSDHFTKQTKTPFWSRMILWCLVWLHVLRGVFNLLFLFPWIGLKQKHEHIQHWSLRLLKIFGLKLSVINAHILPRQPYVLASNHISWIDIHAINAFKPIRFVAKSEVASWPIFGWMAKQLGTVFIRRDSPRHARQVVGQIASVLACESVCIFPEGTSTIGKEVLPFKPNLFESAIDANVKVYSLAIRYRSQVTGLMSDATAFIGDMGLLESMSKILKDRKLIVELIFLPPSSNQTTLLDRKLLALHSHGLIADKLKGL
jgi:1-acyl-sn-glycerol-3-phosphate acyltransferase